jgi:hypothetical protein
LPSIAGVSGESSSCAGAAAAGAAPCASVPAGAAETQKSSASAACAFQTAGTRRGYYRGGQDALIQWKRIATAASGPLESGAC